MNRRRRACLATCVALTTLLSAANAANAPLQVRLRIVEACALDADAARANCRSAHRRSDEEIPAPPQVQQLTPADEDDEDARRPWLTLTF